ncbi:MAG: GNAT family N-acetyltransferase, partial [Candidatus Eremiobacteraeota bacterium]|nr:GNAT family N-acetyltransferase [Candidatus Eremiobacteraeota bacterium]
SFFLVKEANGVIGIGHQLPGRENDGDGEIVPGLMHLSMVAVEPTRWGRGIGRAITVACIERAAELGYDAMQLWTHTSNDRAQRLYTSLGFELTGREKIDDDGERIKLYRRMLAR